ncbi:MAG: 50S ribosomal protein L13 [bacterium]|nr:50S ribosomal protein L13 [bacterium]
MKMANKTKMKTEEKTKTKKVVVKEHTFDASEHILGRLATEVATILQGKHRPDYAPNKAGTDRVLVKNAAKIKVTGNKEKGKIYVKHTGYMGHLNERRLEEMRKKNPTEILKKAVYNMLPKNRLRAKRMKRLRIEA